MTDAGTAVPAASRPLLSATPTTIGLIGFLTLVDLFATQAILPTLAARFNASPAEIGLAVNACTIGMAASGLATALFGGRFDRRRGAAAALALLAIPTLSLAFAADLGVFTALRILQGAFMAAAFTMTMTYLSERCTAAHAASTLAAYVTGAVASNLVGRVVAATLAESIGVGAQFAFFAALNVAGAGLALLALGRARPAMIVSEAARSPGAIVRAHLANDALRATFAIGFLILFAFIGVFTYVNFVLQGPPISLSAMNLGLVYLAFLPSMATTPLAGRAAARFGARLVFIASLALSALALPLLLADRLPALFAGLALFAAGTFFAQATATGFVGRAAKSDRATASGLYLASYYLGGLAGAAIVGRVFERFGWSGAVIAVGAALAAAGLLAAGLPRAAAERP